MRTQRNPCTIMLSHSIKRSILVVFKSLSLCLLATRLLAQQAQKNEFTLSGKIANTEISTLEIHLFNADSQLIKTEFPNQQGEFNFEALPKGAYYFKIRRGQADLYNSEVIQVTQQHMVLPEIRINEQRLETVVINRSRPYIERHDGKLILNVESSLQNTGGSALEVLEKAPGVTVDGNNNIILRGKSNILVQIDGKNSPLTGEELANYLRGLPASAIDKIELITNPSAKYDAAGTAIINIKLKKGTNKGTNGSFSTALGAARYLKNNNSFSINHRNDKLNLFANYNFAYREAYNDLMIDRRFYKEGHLEKTFIQDNFFKFSSRNHNGKIGFDYNLTDKNLVGASVSLTSNVFKPFGDSKTTLMDSDCQPLNHTATLSQTDNITKNISANLNHKYRMDTLGSELSTDFDFIRYINASNQSFDTRTSDNNGAPIGIPYLLKGKTDGDLNIYALKSDWIKILPRGLKLETGFKTSYVKSDNDIKFYDHSTSPAVPDSNKSNHYIYQEYIHAAYGNVTKKWDKLKTVLGLRIENTNVTGTQLTTDQINKRKYTQLFPSVVFSYEFTADHNLEVNLSRRINRPNYQQLNPFKYYINATTYRVGNPDLNAQASQNYELTYSFKGKYIATLSYSKISDNITTVVKPILENGENITVQTEENLKSAAYYSLNLIAPLKLTNWWDINNNANFYYGSYTGNVSGTQINNIGNFTLDINSIHTLKLGKNFAAELAASYKATEVYAFARISPYWNVNIGLQKKFKEKNSLKLALTDAFNSNNRKGLTVYNNYEENFKSRREPRILTLSYSYNFGSSKSVQSRKTGAAEDLRQRAE
ncbi:MULTISPECIES: outer membrane beta-barrel family protein [Sphingobacterium]|uniref:outer membrane beta-barrel family protein n=1 Tax=Sphingobacterium TaxID=28453 RepID=UPI00257DBDFC|nr:MULTISPECIES: outer membrane beta-barrel family protein [Sphingobacterium]